LNTLVRTRVCIFEAFSQVQSERVPIIERAHRLGLRFPNQKNPGLRGDCFMVREMIHFEQYY